MSVIAVIPCRYASKRLPGKPLLAETGKPLVQHVYENALRCKSLGRVIVATDDERIYNAAEKFGAEVVMTSTEHPSGTDRIAEVASRTEGDIFVNIQGDEAELDPSHVDQAVKVLTEDSNAAVSTICSRITDEAELDDPNSVKCVIDKDSYALYFSRARIPYPRSEAPPLLPEAFLRHHGLYCFRRDVLLEYPNLPRPEMESLEKLEQLRLLWHGYKIKVCTVESVARGVDTMEDYKDFVARTKA